MERHEAFLQRAREGPVGLLFLGDSITEGWAGAPGVWDHYYAKWNAANFGVAGDKTQHLLWRITHGELDALDPADAEFEHHLLEALWMHEHHDRVNVPLLKRLLGAKEFRARAAAVRVLQHWFDRVPDGIPLLEAMSFGVPIIAGDLPVIREVAGEAFLPVDTRNPQALAEAMRRLAIRENLRAELAARGRARLAAFSLSLEAGRLAHFLEAAARRQSP